MLIGHLGECMKLDKLEVLDAEISQITERIELARKGQGFSVVLMLSYGMLVSLGQLSFKGYVFGAIVVVALGLFVWSHLMAKELSLKFKESEGCL